MSSDEEALSEVEYTVDAENISEMARLIKQARLVTDCVGLYPHTFSKTQDFSLLDIGCGPGEWALQMAQHYPNCHITGIDVSQIMLAYASSQARELNLRNIHFKNMDAHKPFEFADEEFDAIHARFITAFMGISNWVPFFQNCFRLLQPGGFICSVEFENVGAVSSPALNQFNHILIDALRKTRQCFTSWGDYIGITAMQAQLLQQAGFTDIREQAHSLNFSIGTPAYNAWCENIRAAMKLVQPFLIRQNVITQTEVEALYAQLINEISDESFFGLVYFHSVWAKKPA
jgi:ubiquinone/menaquinone biosynthesis C-methylase UbiE